MLRRLGHCDSDGVIQLKGRVACEINTCDELVVTELIFCGAFTELSPEQSAALLSCMVHQVNFVRVCCAGTTRQHGVTLLYTLIHAWAGPISYPPSVYCLCSGQN